MRHFGQQSGIAEWRAQYECAQFYPFGRLSQGGSLTGRVVDAKTGAGVKGARVETNENNWIDSPFTQLLGNAMARSTTPSKAVTNGNGEFTLTQVN